jgi:LPS sulfotransferase NodH
MAWTSNLRDQAQPRFNYFAVVKHVIRTLREVECWERFYAARNIKPLRIMYEELDEDYQNTMQKVVAYLGIAGTVPAAPIRKQANATTDEWADHFVHAFRGTGVCSRAIRLITRRW